MAAQPPSTPQWDNNLTDIVLPTAGEVADGYPLDAVPTRQKINYLFSIWSLWVAWLNQVRSPVDLDFADGPLPGGTPPPIGAGLVVTASTFSARAIAVGRHVPLTNNGADVYGVTTDNYWDLSRDGVWTKAPVAATTAAPAVTANSVRVYMVRTNATDRTLLVDYRPSVARRLAADFVATVRHFWATALAVGGTGLPTLAERAQPHQTFLAGDVNQATTTFEALTSFEAIAAAGMLALREHVGVDTTGAIVGLGIADRVQIVSVQGMVRSAIADEWIAEATSAFFEFRVAGKLEVWQVDGLLVASSYSIAGLVALNPLHRQDLYHGLRFTNADPAENRAHLEHVRVSLYTEWHADLTDTDESIIEYSGPSILGLKTGKAIAINCRYNKSTGDWDRTIAGDAWLHVKTPDGLVVYRQPAAGGASWDNQVSAGDWEEVASDVAAGSKSLAFIPTTSGAGTPEKNGLYTQNVAKVVGEVVTDGAAGIVFNGLGVSGIIITGANLVARLTFARPMANTAYPVFVTARGMLVEYQKNVAYVDVIISDTDPGPTPTQLTLHNRVVNFSVMVFGNQA